MLGEDGDGLTTGGAADGFPVFGCIVEPGWADASWAAAALCPVSAPFSPGTIVGAGRIGVGDVRTADLDNKRHKALPPSVLNMGRMTHIGVTAGESCGAPPVAPLIVARCTLFHALSR